MDISYRKGVKMIDLADLIEYALAIQKALQIVSQYNPELVYNTKKRLVSTALLYDSRVDEDGEHDNIYSDDDIERILMEVYQETGLQLIASKGMFFWHFRLPKGGPGLDKHDLFPI